jgi:hypothetical protein
LPPSAAESITGVLVIPTDGVMSTQLVDDDRRLPVGSNGTSPLGASRRERRICPVAGSSS